MPLYEYECKKCGKTFEVIQKFSDDPLKKHPDCGGKVERLLSAPGLQFKGTGWYITDYARSGGGGGGGDKPAAASSGSDTPAASAASSSEKKSDSGGKGKKQK